MMRPVPQREALLALRRVAAEAELVANRALAQTGEPDLLVDLQWTLAQCRMRVVE